jgi:hypothetical protein
VNRRIAVGTALATGVLILGTACSSSSKGATSSASATPSQTSSGPIQGSSSSQAPPSAEQLARSQALDLAREYYATIDTLASSSTLSLNGLDSVASGANVTQEKSALAEYRTSGWVQRGTTVLSRATVVSVDLTNEPSNSPEVLPTVHLTTCIDVSKVREVDVTGKSVTLPTRANFFIETLTAVNIPYPSSTGWRISEVPNKAAKSCSAE